MVSILSPGGFGATGYITLTPTLTPAMVNKGLGYVIMFGGWRGLIDMAKRKSRAVRYPRWVQTLAEIDGRCCAVWRRGHVVLMRNWNWIIPPPSRARLADRGARLGKKQWVAVAYASPKAALDALSGLPAEVAKVFPTGTDYLNDAARYTENAFDLSECGGFRMIRHFHRLEGAHYSDRERIEMALLPRSYIEERLAKKTNYE